MVQAAGDCHCLNFGGFATPERRLAFDINDFDETAVGAVGMGPQAPRRQLRRRHARRSWQGGAPRARRDRGARLSRDHGRDRRRAGARDLVPRARPRRRRHGRAIGIDAPASARRTAARTHPVEMLRSPSRSSDGARASTTIPTRTASTIRAPADAAAFRRRRRGGARWTTPNRSPPSAARSCSAIAWPTRPTRWWAWARSARCAACC